MLKEKTAIGPGLLFMVLFISLFSYGVIESPHAAAKYIGNNGYWGFLLAFGIAIPVIAVTCRLGRRFPRKSVIQYLPEVMGKPLGKALGFLYLVVIMVLMIWASRAISEQLSVYFLNRTPMWVSVFIFLAVATFVAYQGIEGISRLASFLFPVTFFFSMIAILFSFQNFDLENIRPVFLLDGLKIPLGSVISFLSFYFFIDSINGLPVFDGKRKRL